MYVAFAATSNGTGPRFGYERQFQMLTLSQLFSEKPPLVATPPVQVQQ
jgi:hypothetical protein